MGILELQAEVPDAFEQIEKGTRGLYSFEKGLFTQNFTGSEGRLEGILGYDSTVRTRLLYRPPHFHHSTNLTSLRLFSNRRLEILSSNRPQLALKDGILSGKTHLTKEDPLIVDVRISSNHLQDPYDFEANQPRYSDWPLTDSPQALVDLVQSLGFEDKRNLPLVTRTSFKLKNIFPILNWLRDFTRYGQVNRYRGPEKVSDFLTIREGDCEAFTDMFRRMVYIAGGTTRFTETIALNLPLQGYPYFSRSPSFTTGHALSFIYADQQWHLVDPTVYNSTFHNPHIPNGLEKRALHPSLKNLQLVYTPKPELQFLDYPCDRPLHLPLEEEAQTEQKMGVSCLPQFKTQSAPILVSGSVEIEK